ncbi:MAG TPA: (d)CMP kinase [Atopostipes sp.]|nr:(d)CMP kinase [Atopostipes sp.]
MVTLDYKIAIDGPASSGKSTIAKILADKYSLVYVDTGAMYRTLTYLALKNNVPVTNEDLLLKLLKETTISFKKIKEGQLVFADDEDVTEAIRSHEVTNNVSEVSAFAKIREELVSRQQKIAKDTGVVMDGRDIGTVVLPNADVKIFLVASVEERAERRYLENQAKGIDSDFERLKQEIIARDDYDSNREVSPLKQASDAVRLDTTSLSIEEVVEKCMNIIERKKKN